MSKNTYIKEYHVKTHEEAIDVQRKVATDEKYIKSEVFYDSEHITYPLIVRVEYVK